MLSQSPPFVRQIAYPVSRMPVPISARSLYRWERMGLIRLVRVGGRTMIEDVELDRIMSGKVAIPPHARRKAAITADAHSASACRAAMTVAALIDGIERSQANAANRAIAVIRTPEPKKANGQRDRKVYMRSFMRQKRALAKAQSVETPSLRVVASQ
jgi:hypothetical protein